MKTIAYYPIHYGSEYLRESILSINDIVEKIVILYSPTPTYGHSTDLKNPDSEELLRSIVSGATNKAEWVNIEAHNESEHRHKINEYNAEYDLTLAVDADEVFEPQSLENALKEAYTMPYARFGIDGFVNFFRDFNNVCYDGFRPIRIYKRGSGEYLDLKCTIYHFGYAQNEDIIRYKISIHGHKAEIRENWIDEVYLSDRKNDLHPVSRDLWFAQPFDKSTLPLFMRNHPKYKL